MQKLAYPDEQAVRHIETRAVARAEQASTKEPDFAYSTKVGVAIGFGVGLLVGVLQLLFMGPAAVETWARVVTILISCGLGWALFGWIVGGSGVFSGTRRHQV